MVTTGFATTYTLPVKVNGSQSASGFHAIQNGNTDNKNKYILKNSNNDVRNVTIERNIIINRKKYKNAEEKERDNLINNDYFLNKNKKLVKSFLNNNYNNYNETFENEYSNRENNKYMQRGLNAYYQNENKDILNFSNNNKKKFSVTKKDLKQFNRNGHYIQKIMDNLPLNKNKIKNNFNYDHRKHANDNINYNYSKLNNKDNNIDYYNYKQISYNNYFKKELNNNNINNNSLLNNCNNINNKLKTVRASKYLSVERGKTFINSNNINEYNKFENKKVNYNHQTINSAYKCGHTPKISLNETKNKKYSPEKSPYLSVKNKNYTDFFCNVNGRKFRHLLIIFLDIKTILNLSCVNTKFYKNTKDSIYTYIFNNLLIDQNKNKDKFIHQVLNSVKSFCSDTIKKKIIKKEMKNFFEKLLVKNEIYDDIILKDLPRTIPSDISFNIGHTNYYKLYNILTCYSNYNKKIGYAQGLNFICAQAIYLFSSEEEVFVFLEGLINIMKMDNFLGVGNEKKMLYKLKEFSNILYRYVPKIIQFFNEKSVSHDFFSTGWIFTLFSTSMERNYLVILWCFMIIFRWKFVYAFIIQILKRYERDIINVSEGQLCFKMKNLLRQRDFKKDFNAIIEDTLNFMKNYIVL